MLLEMIEKEIKEAMISKDTEKRDQLRAIKSRANLEAKEKHTEVTDEIIVKAVQKEMKELNQTISSLSGKEDSKLYKETRYRINLLEKYLPKLMSEEEVIESVKKIVEGLGDVPFGKKMQAVMAELKGKADGKMIQKVVKGL